jgi:hypothetical protein
MRFVYTCVLIVACAILWYSCVQHDIDQLRTSPENLTISLRWIKSYPGETKGDVEKGLKWCFSFLGASLPKGSLDEGLVWKDDSKVSVSISALGFSEQAQAVWVKLLDHLKKSEEYSVTGAIDIGRFVMLALNSPNHYYAITGAAKTYNAFRNGRSFLAKKAAVVTSVVAHHSRVIEISEGTEISDIAFVSMEGEGSIENNTFLTAEYEVISIMKNGQLRFAMYGLDGKFKTSADPVLTRAGKPSKCLWCHEITLGTPLLDNSNISGYFSRQEFEEEVRNRMELIRQYRKTLSSDLDFGLTQEHTKAELLYLGFMEPSEERLSLEWGLNIEETRQKLLSLTTHAQDEFEFLGSSLYYRKDVDALSPIPFERVSDDARERSEYEPDFIH